MEKQLITIIKKANSVIKKSSIDIVKYARVEQSTLYITNIEEFSIISKNCGLDDGIYLVSDLAIGKKLRKNNLEIGFDDFPTITEVNDFEVSFNTKNDFKSFLNFKSSDVGVLNGVYVDYDGNKIATDSFVMRYDINMIDRDKSVVLNSIGTELLSQFKVDDFEFNVIDNSTVVEVGETKLILTNLVNTFPNINQVIPKNIEHSVTLSKSDMNIISSLVKFKYHTIYFIDGFCYASDLDKKDVVIVKAKISLPINIAINLKYLAKMVNEGMVLNLTNSKMPIRIDTNMLIMPYKYNDLDINNCDELTL